MAVIAGSLHQAGNLRLCQVFTGAQGSVGTADRCHCPILSCWRHQPQPWFYNHIQFSYWDGCPNKKHFPDSVKQEKGGLSTAPWLRWFATDIYGDSTD